MNARCSELSHSSRTLGLTEVSWGLSVWSLPSQDRAAVCHRRCGHGHQEVSSVAGARELGFRVSGLGFRVLVEDQTLTQNNNGQNLLSSPWPVHVETFNLEFT